MLRAWPQLSLACLLLALVPCAASAQGTGDPVTELISIGPKEENPADAGFEKLSDDGRRVFFRTATRLTDEDADDKLDYYMREGTTTTLVSKAGPGASDPGTFDVQSIQIARDGSRAAFISRDPLTTDDTDGGDGTPNADVFLWADGQVRLVSRATGAPDPSAAHVTLPPSQTDSLGEVFFKSAGTFTADDTDAADLAANDDVFVGDGTTSSLVSKPGGGFVDPGDRDVDIAQPGGAADGGNRVFLVTAQKMSNDDTDAAQGDVYMRDRAASTTTLMSGRAALPDNAAGHVNFEDASADGSRVFFSTTAALTADDTDDSDGTPDTDIYERSLAGTGPVRASRPAAGTPEATSGSVFLSGMSRDGSRLFLRSVAKLTADDGDASDDVFKRENGDTTLATRPTGVADPGTQINTQRVDPQGRLYFDTKGRYTADDNDAARGDIYAIDGSGNTILVSGADGVPDPDTGDVELVGFSPDGAHVMLRTAQRLTATDNDSNRTDIYVRSAGRTHLVSKAQGIPDPDAFDFVSSAGLSNAGVAFSSREKLVAADGDDLFDTYFARFPGPPQPPPDGGLDDGPGPGPVDLAPALGRVTASASTFRIGTALPQAAGRRRTPTGTRIRFTLSEAARVTFTFDRRVAGRRARKRSGRCRPPSPRIRRNRKCTRLVRAGSFAIAGKQGVNVLRFRGRLPNRRLLKPGRHRMSVVATDTTGKRSATRRLNLRLLPRRR